MRSPGQAAEVAYFLARNRARRWMDRFAALSGNPRREYPKKNIYPELGLVFVHIPKTAGTSVHNLFSTMCNRVIGAPHPRRDELEKVRRKLTAKHLKASELRSAMGDELWNECVKFTLVRNPWDLMVSSYSWWLEKATEYDKLLGAATEIRAMSGFNEFMRSKYGSEMINEYVGSYSDWFTERGKPIVDFVGKVESLDQDLRQVSSLLKVKIPELPAPKNLNASKRGSYQSYYDDISRQIIERRFKEAIEQFHYTF